MPVRAEGESQVWRRRTPAKQYAIWFGWLVATAIFVYCWQLISDKTTWFFVLDAPGEVLFARKGEHGVERLEEQRQSYRRLAETIPRCIVVDAARDADDVRRDVTRTVWETFRRRKARES